MSSPPVEMDMAWARDKDINFPPDKNLRIFVLWGDFGREGQWLSKFLPKSVRAGRTPVLMFEENRWQPLRPLGIRYGLEIPFSLELADRLPSDDVVGVVICNGDSIQVADLADAAQKQISGRVVAIIQLREKALDREAFSTKWAERLDNPDLLLIDMTPHSIVSPTDLDRSAVVSDKGAAMAAYVLNKLKTKEVE